MGDMCDCDDCGGVRDCGCGPEKPSNGSCSNGYCEVTSQNTGASRMQATTMNRNAARMFRGTQLSAYDVLALRVGPQTPRNGPMFVAAMTGDALPPDLNLPYPQYAASGQTIDPRVLQPQPTDNLQQSAARRLLAYVQGWSETRMRNPSSAEQAVIRPLQQAMGFTGRDVDGKVGTNTANRIALLINVGIPGLTTIATPFSQPLPGFAPLPGQVAPTAPTTKTGGAQAQVTYAPQGGGTQTPTQQQAHGGGMAPEVQQALINLGTTGLQGLTGVISTALSQGGQTDRTRIEADYRRDVARMQSQGLLTQQQAADAMNAFQSAAAQTPVQPNAGMGPMGAQQNWWDTLTDVEKAGVVGGAAVGLAGIGYLVYRATR